ncbi:hypothetical protein VitviT2T_015959 [Vitis vinifera]|uniref:Uncharacterized protein n=1 Tax=Vitis vinifera TaxID=29760 RepID=A0ABY9CQH1_VITVI|nr:hypothetical protein VitviT2T_015959 [Vitis vinifera]
MQEMANRDRMMDGKQNDLSQKIDNLQYQISRLTNLNTTREVKVVITLRSGKEVDLPTPKPEQEPEQEPETEAEKEKREENKGKKKGSNTKKEDVEAKVNEKSERTINQEEVIKKHMPPPFLQALHGKRGINNASGILKFHPGEEEGLEEVCMIDNLVEEHCDKKMLEDLNENFGDLDEGLLEPLDLLANLPHLKTRKEILPLFNEEETPETIKEEPPKLILKPLPTELKYAYLEENKESPVVISSSLTTT